MATLNKTHQIVGYQPVQAGVKVTFLNLNASSDDLMGGASYVEIYCTDAELATAVSTPQLNALLTDKLNRQWKNDSQSDKLQTAIDVGQQIII